MDTTTAVWAGSEKNERSDNLVYSTSETRSEPSVAQEENTDAERHQEKGGYNDHNKSTATEYEEEAGDEEQYDLLETESAEEVETEEEEDSLSVQPIVQTFQTQDLPNISYDIVINGDVTIIKNTTYINQNVLYTGNVTLSSTLNVKDNSNVTVLGTLNVNNGTHTFQGKSKLYVGGDLRIQSKNADGIYGVTSGMLTMRDSAYLTVIGDFYTQSTASTIRCCQLFL